MSFAYGANRAFQRLIQTAEHFASSHWPILILGETGVGKELVARFVHQRSLRHSGPFVPVNCAAIPAGLFESELFGFERGAFSGANQSSRGLLRSANHGTLFLDEIGDLDLSLQVKLLRMMDLGEVRSLGGLRAEQVDVRVVAATNVNLFEAVAESRFRQDLLERLGVLTLEVPPLRDRPEDIPLIAVDILRQMNGCFEDDVTASLLSYHWPGNVRQLRNLLARASVMGRGKVSQLGINDVIREERKRSESVQAKDFHDASLAEIEKQVIVDRLKRFHGNRKRAAEELGIAKSTLQEKLRRWKLESAEPLAWPMDSAGRDTGIRIQ